MSRRDRPDRREATLPQPPPMPVPATPVPTLTTPAPAVRVPPPAVPRPAPPLVQAPAVGVTPTATKPAEAVREEERRHIPNPQRRQRGELGANEHQR